MPDIEDEKPEMGIPHVVISIPCYTWNIKIQTARSIIAEIMTMTRLGWKVELGEAIGDALIGRARNTMVSDFLANDSATHLVFIDDDVVWQPGAVAKMVAAAVDVVGLTYRTRADPENYAVTPDVDEGGHLQVDEERGLMKMRTLMGGLMCLSKSSMERARDRSVKYVNQQGQTCWNIFESGVYNGEYWGEDAGFCRNWQSWGFDAWTIPAESLAHIGPKIFEGNYAEWLMREGVRLGHIDQEEIDKAKAKAEAEEAEGQEAAE